MKVHVMDLKPGDRLIADVFNSYGLLVLSAHTILDDESIANLIRHNIDYTDIFRNGFRSSSTDLPPTAAIQLSFSTSMDDINGLFEQAMVDGKIDPTIVDSSFETLADSICEVKDLVSLMISMEQRDDYTYNHSVQVGTLSYYISKWIGHSEEDSLIAGKAGFLHDIGKSTIPVEILHKPTRLTEQEYELVKSHTVTGYDILCKSYDPHSAIPLAALQHHERYNRKGYPNQSEEKQIHPISKIVAVADIYSAMTSTRVYQKEQDMLNVLRELYRLSFGETDPYITQIFIKNMLPHFIGKNVTLNTGESGVIVMTNPTDFFRPLIQINQQFIDLSFNRELTIEKIS